MLVKGRPLGGERVKIQRDLFSYWKVFPVDTFTCFLTGFFLVVELIDKVWTRKFCQNLLFKLIHVFTFICYLKLAWEGRLPFCSTCSFVNLYTVGHVQYIDILVWLRGFQVKIFKFLKFFCHSIPKRLEYQENKQN